MVDRLVVGIAIIVVVGNILLLLVLVSLVALIQPRFRHGEGIDTVVTKELCRLNNISKESDLPQIRDDIADIYSKEGNLNKPALHMEIASGFNTSDKLPILTWQSESDASFYGSDVSYENGAVNIAVGGYYYIYCGIRYSGSGTEELDYGRILHNVIMKKKGEETESPTILMQNLQSTPVIRRGHLAYTTSSLGGTFYLPSSSKVMVTSSIPRNIDTSPHGSYFGLFLM